MARRRFDLSGGDGLTWALLLGVGGVAAYKIVEEYKEKQAQQAKPATPATPTPAPAPAAPAAGRVVG